MDAASEKTRWPAETTFMNNADNIARYLREDGHRTWGFVIYRCIYDSDDEWNQFMELLRKHIRRSLEIYSGLDMIDSLSITVIEDDILLDDATTFYVREHFKQWAATASQQEQGTGPALSQRYHYCLQVDAAALEFLFDDPGAPPDAHREGFVNIIRKDWEPEGPDSMEPAKEPIEGCTAHDVGWMMADYRDVMVGMYCYLREHHSWYTEYRRPPQVAHA